MKHNKHIILSVFLSLVTAIQGTVIVAGSLSFKKAVSPLSALVVPEWQSLLRPEWETLIYRFFVVFVIMSMVFWLNWINKVPNVRRYVIAEGLLTAGMLGACFKMTVYASHPQLAGKALIALGILALLIKICWPWINGQIEALKEFFFAPQNNVFLDRLLALAMPVMIFLTIDVPNIPGAVARFFVGEQFHHNDSFIYGPAWAYVSGTRLDWDIISQYGVGVGAIWGSLSRFWGGFNYESGLQMMVAAAIVYYILLFFVMRAWLKSTLLAAAGILLVIKFQMFNAGVYPFAFTYGSATVLRNWFDIIVIAAVLAHIERPQLLWLIAAACACGLQLFYIPSDGVYLLAMFVFYLFCWITLQGGWKRGGHLAVLVLPPVVMFLLMWLFIGPVVWQNTFWNNTREFVAYFLNGFGLTPIYSGLQDRQFLASLMGFVLPFVYVLTLLSVGTLIILKRIAWRNIFACVIAVYGLCLYHYYVARSGSSSYYVVSIPFVMLMVFWVSKLRAFFDIHIQKQMGLSIFVLSVLALALNQNFISYPNRLNFSPNPLTDTAVAQPLDKGGPYFHHLYRDYNEALKVPLNTLGEKNEGLVAESDFTSDDQLLLFYRSEADFTADAALIDKLTKPEEPVALISSFEIKMLMDAKRRPFFYYFPLAISHPLRSRTLVRSSVYTIDQLNNVLNKIAKDKPPHIFVERILLTRPLSQDFFYYYSSMLYLVDYVLQHYEPIEQGKYLVALRLKF